MKGKEAEKHGGDQVATTRATRFRSIAVLSVVAFCLAWVGMAVTASSAACEAVRSTRYEINGP